MKTKKLSADKDKLITLLAPPAFVIVLMLAVFKFNGLYPFGTKSLSWCDMSQQVVPLLTMFKDILDGKGSMFLNFQNSGGMNFYGVFFFFLASPFTFLVKFVPKENMLAFANILVMLKMAVCAFTASLCITDTRKSLDRLSVIFLSILYPFCGYTMMYFQNNIWLDMMYLFPLLVMALMRLTKKQNNLMYIIVLTAMAVVNYYICYMIVVFLFLFIGIYTFMNRKSPDCALTCRRFVSGSLIAALLSAVVWLPSLLQYLTSGRGETGIIESLSESNMVTGYQTTLPMLFCSPFLFVVLIHDITSKRERSQTNRIFLGILGLTLIPFLLEPINRMWHTGNYMSFPCRFGFITVFLAILCAAYTLEEKFEYKNKLSLYAIGGLSSIAFIFAAIRYSFITRANNEENICRYSSTLWGDDGSFKLLLGIFLVTVLAYAAVFLSYKYGSVFKTVFIVLSLIIFTAESYNNCMIYVVHPAERNIERHEGMNAVYNLSDEIKDDDFVRVKSYAKVINNNMIGSAGFNSIAHYTSLNDRDYMFTMKRLGYSGVWMETSSVGGTRLTDALLSIRYEINGGLDNAERIYEDDDNFLYRLSEYLPMGLLLEKGSLDGCEEIPEGLTRTGVQQYLSENLFDLQLITPVDPDEPVSFSRGMYNIKKGMTITYTINIEGRQSVYVDCFDKLTNHLSEPIFDAFSISVNNNQRTSAYPQNTNNGLYRVGDYCDEKITVVLKAKKDVSCKSFGLFLLDNDRLSEICENAQGADMKIKGSGLAGSCTADSAKTCFVSVPYQNNFKVKVNGKTVEYKKAFSDFICFDIEAGKNDISITYTPQGFGAGVILTLVGIALLVVYLLLRNRLDTVSGADRAMQYLVLTGAAAVFAVIYIMPLFVNIMNLTPK